MKSVVFVLIFWVSASEALYKDCANPNNDLSENVKYNIVEQIHVATIADLNNLLREHNNNIKVRETYFINTIEEKNEIIKSQEKNFTLKYQEITKILENLTEVITNYRIEVALKDGQIQDKNEQLKTKETQINTKNYEINELREEINSKNEEMKNQTEVLTNFRIEAALKDTQIRDKNEQLKAKDTQKNDEIKDLREQIKSTQEELIALRNQNQYISENLNSTSDQLAKYTFTEHCPNGEAFFEFKIRGINTFQAWCSNEWMVIQRRFDGSENFYRSWNDYKEGFGKIDQEFFFGLEKLHLMTEARTYELFIYLEYIDGTNKFARYNDFKIGSERESYYLKSLGEYFGTAGQAFQFHIQANFSTFDRGSTGCAQVHEGGWWFNDCGYSMLNGNYFENGKYPGSKKGIYWGNSTVINYDVSYTYASMSIKPTSF